MTESPERDGLTPRVKYGLMIGAAGLLLNTCFSALMACCGPVAALLTGAVAGFLTAREEDALTQSDGAHQGAISGLIAGTFVLVGQFIGTTVILAIYPALDVPPLFGELPDAANVAGQAGYWLGGLGIAFCIGLLNLAFSAGAGALAGYLASPAEGDLLPSE